MNEEPRGHHLGLSDVLRDALLRPEADADGRFITGPASRPCWHCDGMTHYLEVNYETPLHPGYCTRQKDREYGRAMTEQTRSEEDR